MCRPSQYHVINKENLVTQMNFEHLNNKLLRSTTWTNKPKIGTTRTTWRMQGRIKATEIENILRQSDEKDMTHK